MKEMELVTEQKRHYGFFTTVAMIVGIVIGSGIFFKTDNILIATSGNVALGVLVFCVAAFAIVFGCLSLSKLAALTDRPGGLITYFEEFANPKFASAFGWFQTFVYYPTLTVVISWVVGIYISLLFNIPMALETQVAIGFGWFLLCYFFNILSAKAGGAFQNASVVIKLIPLILMGVLGFALGDPLKAITQPTEQAMGAMKTLAWFSAIGPIAFSFDGWVISTAIGFEIKQSKRNLPRALVLAPLCILVAYLVYFTGVSSYLGVDQVMTMQDESVSLMATNLFGSFAAKGILVFVVISVMGTVNGVVLGSIRLPYSLALKGMIPGAKWLSKTHPKTGMPVNGGLYSMLICLVWWVLHYLVQKFELLPNTDISEIAIAVSYLLYLVLYYQVFRLWKEKRVQGVGNGVVFPILAAIGSLFILFGALQNSLFPLFVLICAVVLAAGYLYMQSRKQQA